METLPVCCLSTCEMQVVSLKQTIVTFHKQMAENQVLPGFEAHYAEYFADTDSEDEGFELDPHVDPFPAVMFDHDFQTDWEDGGMEPVIPDFTGTVDMLTYCVLYCIFIVKRVVNRHMNYTFHLYCLSLLSFLF